MILSVIEQVQALLKAKNLPSQEEIKLLVDKDSNAAAYVLLEQAKQINQLQSNPKQETPPSTPSGMIAPYLKKTANGKKKKPGQKKGHKGTRREKPAKIDRQESHRLECCPECGGTLQCCNGEHSQRTRIIEDIPKSIEPETTEHTIHRDYCPCCKKFVEPKVADALPKSTLGNQVTALSAYWHYGLGLTGAQIRDTLNYHLQFRVTEGGLFSLWHKLGSIFRPWYEQIANEIKNSAVLHADETGWRVNGHTHWLWCFASKDATYYMIDPSRGEAAITDFFQETFAGTLVTDFWHVYDKVICDRHQYCLPHLLRELKKVNESNASEEWQLFSKRTRRLFQDAIRLRAKEDFTPERYESRIDILQKHLIDLALDTYQDADAKRLGKRLHKYWDQLLTFLDYPEVPSNNNHGEREIRFAVLIRKITYGNRSDQGALTQSILMTIFRTLRIRGHNPIDVIVTALREYIMTGNLPPFPSNSISIG